MCDVSPMGCLVSGSATEWMVALPTSRPSQYKGPKSVRVFHLGCLSGFSVSVYCQSFPSRVFVLVLRQRFLSRFSVWVFVWVLRQRFRSGFSVWVFVWALRQRFRSGFSVWCVCLGSPSAFSVRCFPSGVFVWALRPRFLSGFSFWGVCLGSLSGFSIWVVCLRSPSAFIVLVFRLGFLSGYSVRVFHLGSSGFSVSVFCQGFPFITEISFNNCGFRLS
jgi:hypothetical protein